MQIINDGLPEEVFALIKHDWYNKKSQLPNYCSVTDLLNPPKIFYLKKRFYDEVEVPASRLLEITYGNVWHLGLAEILKLSPDCIVEQRIYFTINLNGKKYVITGKPDAYKISEKKLIDHKETSVWTIIKESRIDEWSKQLNIYAYALRKGFYTKDMEESSIAGTFMNKRVPINLLEIQAKGRDWRKAEARKGNYIGKVSTIPIKLLDIDEAENMIKVLLSNIVKYEDVDVNDIPECNFHERWETKKQFAVMKKGRKSAVRLYDNIEDAKQHIYYKTKKADKSKCYIQERPSEMVRCRDYCYYNKYCNYYQQCLQEEK